MADFESRNLDQFGREQRGDVSPSSVSQGLPTDRVVRDFSDECAKFWTA
jgi:hypothetical protein